MKIGNTDVKISILPIIVFAIFAFGFVFAALFGSPEMVRAVRSQAIWIVPALFLFLVIPAILNYMSQREYDDLAPEYETRAKQVRIRLINESMIGKIVKLEGIVEAARFKFLNRPQFTVADRTGEISVKMFTNPREDIKVNDVVEVYGQVIRRYIVIGDPVVNCVAIRKIDKKISAKKNE
jgi:hypothetical protein